MKLLSSSKRSLPAPESIGTTMMMRDIKHAEVQQQVASSDKPEASDLKLNCRDDDVRCGTPRAVRLHRRVELQ
eukprot:scaffold31010_cov78-Skeletonema_dohrnii-CCMP3373.AAC.1